LHVRSVLCYINSEMKKMEKILLKKNWLRFMIISTLIFGACDQPLVPYVPTWDADLYVVVLSEEHSTSDLISDNPNLHFSHNSDGTIQLSMPNGWFQDNSITVLNEETVKRFECVNQGVVSFEITNYFPVEIQLAPVFYDNMDNVTFETKTVNGEPITIKAAKVNANGLSVSPVKTKIDIVMSTMDFLRISQSRSVKLNLVLRTPGADPVFFRPEDYVKIRAYASVNIQANISSIKN